MVVSPTAVAKYGSNFGIHPVGAGPYQFVSEVTNESVNVARFPGYRGGPAPLAGIDWKVYQTDMALVSAIKTGVVQVASGVSPNDVNSLKADSQLVVNVGPSSGITGYVLQCQAGPGQQPRRPAGLQLRPQSPGPPDCRHRRSGRRGLAGSPRVRPATPRASLPPGPRT